MRKILRKPILSAETGGKGCRKSCDVQKRAENIGEDFYMTGLSRTTKWGHGYATLPSDCQTYQAGPFLSSKYVFPDVTHA